MSASKAFDDWAATYDSEPNPLLALEERLLRPRLDALNPARAVDVGCGTGRRLRYWSDRGIPAVGIDFSLAMLQAAAARLPGREGLILAGAAALPIATAAVELITCSFALSYFPDPAAALREAARILSPQGRLVISDLHPQAYAQGWKREFQGPQGKIRLHAPPIDEQRLQSLAQSAELSLVETYSASFSEPERPLFDSAGRLDLWLSARDVPAVQVSVWRRYHVLGASR